MYVYIYDDFLDSSRYNKTINKIEIRLTDLGLNGKIIRLGGIKNIKGTIQNEIKLGTNTFVAVGNNQTVNKIISAIISSETYGDLRDRTLLGIIPVGGDNSIANSFGIKNELDACNILLARRVEKIDLGLVSGHYFLNEAVVQSIDTRININDYSLESSEKGKIRIINLLSSADENIISNPHDGLLDIVIKVKKRTEAVLRTNRLTINSSHNILIDGTIEIESPADISVMKNKINIVVGKNRLFD